MTMSIAETSGPTTVVPLARTSTSEVEPFSSRDRIPPIAQRPLNRIQTVRLQQGITLRTVARGRRVSLRQARAEEHPHSDVRLSTIYRWQQFLEVPIADLLVESRDPLSRPVLERARLVKLMKTIATIRQRARSEETQRLAEMLYEQAIELMPELSDVQPWQRIGQRRTLDEVGRIAEHQMPDDFFAHYDG